ncbi:MAG: TonB-dependent receptor plug domain-containing protein, partial [Solimonas sp.]
IVVSQSYSFRWLLIRRLPASLLLLAAPCAARAEPPPEGATELAPVVVTATRTEKTLDDTPIRTEIVDRAEIERTNARSLKDALENVPGLQLQQVHGKSGYQLSLQGLTSDQVLVLIDGLPITSSTGSTTDLSQYSLAEVDHIEIVRGATSAQYGSAAMGGIINVITRRIEPGLAGAVSGDLGSYGGQNPSGRSFDAAQKHAQLRVEGGTQTLRARLAGDFVDDDGFSTDPDGWVREGDGMRRQQYAGRVDWRPAEAGLFWFDGSLYREDDDSRYEYFVPPNTIPQQRLESVDRDRYSGGGNWNWDNGMRAEIKGVSERYDSHSREFSNSVQTGNRNAGMGLDHVTAQLDLPPWWHQLWTLGGDYDRESLRQTSNGASELEGQGDATRSSRELFVQNDVLLGDDWELLLGGRWQDDSDFGSHAVPKLGLRAHLLHEGDWDGTVRASFGQGYRVPNLKERHYLFDHSSLGYKVIGNPDLKPEQSNSWQLGASLGWRAVLKADVNVFRNDVRDLIQTDLEHAQVIGGIAYYTYENVARAMTQGAETSLRWTATRTLDFTAAYTYTDTEDKTAGGELTRRPRHMARLGADWTLPTRTELSLRGRYQSSELVANDSGAISGRSPAWTTVDLKINQTLTEGLSAFAGIDNVFDRQRDFDDSNDFGPVVGRFIYLGARYAWQVR